MIDSEDESGSGVNIWIGFADLFAGLLLVALMGLAVVVDKYRDQALEDIKFSSNLVHQMNKATDINKHLMEKLRARLPESIEQPEYSETEIVIPAEALFVPFGFDVTDSKKRDLLAAIREALKESLDEARDDRNFLRIVIQGHTDSDPIKKSAITKQIPTNWELSSRRATGVLRFFEEGGLTPADYNVVAMGLADKKSVAPNDTEENRARNRRIVIRIEPDLNKIRASQQQEE